jgi:hypothetical protein
MYVHGTGGGNWENRFREKIPEIGIDQKTRSDYDSTSE